MKLVLALGPACAQAQALWKWLQQQGVLPARPSRREQLGPEALSVLMTKTLRSPQAGATVHHHQHKLWAELAADLVLANVDQPLWGWAQHLDEAQLAFWLDFDPSTQLAIGYTSPQETLRELLQGGQLPSDAQVDQALRQWHAQHSQLLKCHYQHRQHSVLVNTQAPCRTHGAATSARAVLQALGLAHQEPRPDSGQGAAAEVTSLPTIEQQLEDSLLNGMVGRLPEVATLYQELEAVAHWPLAEAIEAPEPPSVPAMWQALHLSQSHRAQALREREALHGQLTQLSQQLARESGAQKQQRDENELLLAQLHQVQEELETLFIQRGELTTSLKAEQAARAQEQAQWAQMRQATEQALATEKASLIQRLQASEAEILPARNQLDTQQQQLKTLAEENDLLLAQLHQVQEELETLFIQRGELTTSLKAEQAARAQEQTDWAQKLQASEQALDNEKASQMQRLLAAEAELQPAKTQLATQQQQLKELTEENDLLLAQLHQVQEELEHYFLQLKQARQSHQTELAPLRFECDFWRRHTPAEVWVDLRQDIAGDGWYEAEADGRWTGPELTSTLSLPPLAPGVYTLELHLADAIEPELVSGLRLQAVQQDGTPIQPIELLHEFGAGPSLYPMVSLGNLQLPALDGAWALQLSLPYNVSPADTGGPDTRRLGVRVQGLRLSVNETDAMADVPPGNFVDAEAYTTAQASPETSAATL